MKSVHGIRVVGPGRKDDARVLPRCRQASRVLPKHLGRCRTYLFYAAADRLYIVDLIDSVGWSFTYTAVERNIQDELTVPHKITKFGSGETQDVVFFERVSG